MSLQENLKDLFQRDQHVRGLRSRQDAAGRRRNAQQKKLDQLSQQHAELAEELKRSQAHAATLEQDAAGVEARMDKLREQMNAVKTNKEYSALLVEVNTLKIEKGKTEEIALEQMTRIEEMQARTTALHAKVQEQQKLVELATREVEEAQAEVGDQLAQVTAERDAAAERIPGDVLKLYRKLNDDTEGEALCVIEEQDRKRREYTCGGCFVALPVQFVNATISKPDELTQCPYCDRILHVSEELRTGLASPK